MHGFLGHHMQKSSELIAEWIAERAKK
jgi:hypothetical protein